MIVTVACGSCLAEGPVIHELAHFEAEIEEHRRHAVELWNQRDQRSRTLSGDAEQHGLNPYRPPK